MSPRAPTYGELLAATSTAVEHACPATAEPGAASMADAAVVHAELLGYERFLRVAGRHLGLLEAITHTGSRARRRLASYLANLPVNQASTGAWYQAASTLGAAHDLLATHLGTGLVARTPQAEEFLGTTNLATIATAAGDTTRLVLHASEAWKDLTRTAQRTQQRLPADRRPITTAHLRHLQKVAASTDVFTKAALWDHDHDPSSAPDSDPAHQLAAGSLDDLQPAVLTTPGAASPAFSDTLAALRLLRQASYTQGRGEADASPASLRDLALLGARFTQPAPWPPAASPGASGLERLQRAHALDALERAHAAWTAAGKGLTTYIQGITRAPGAYGSAVRRLLTADTTDTDAADPDLRTAVLSALPALARDAEQSIRDLGRQGALLGPQRDLSLRRQWRALPDDAIDELAARFGSAGQASAAVHELQRQSLRRRSQAATTIAVPAPSRSRERVAESHR